MVQGSKDSYVVDMQVELCSCRSGQTGVPCKHLAAVNKHFVCSSPLFLSIDNAERRAELVKLAGGKPNISITTGIRLLTFPV